MKYIVASTAITDDIYFPDGKVIENVGGGAGWYAYSGISLWTDKVLLVSGVGSDFGSLHGAWFVRNKADTSGLIVKTDHSPRTKIQYHPDGERTETPAYGLKHYKSIEPKPEDLDPFCSDCKGMYVFKNVDDLLFWEDLIVLKKRYKFILMWEIAADAAVPEKKETVLKLLKHVDILSINRSEAIKLFQKDEDETLPILKNMNLPLIFYRKGKKGALIIQNGFETEVPSIDITDRMDPTGAGNSSSGAVLIGFCEGKNPEETGLMGSISAAYMISQFGPIPIVNKDIRVEAEKILQENMSKQYTR
jgi:sugar/nucleoside kinase (ribokinase family)